jgi:hypothetical protein
VLQFPLNLEDRERVAGSEAAARAVPSALAGTDDVRLPESTVDRIERYRNYLNKSQPGIHSRVALPSDGGRTQHIVEGQHKPLSRPNRAGGIEDIPDADERSGNRFWAL